MFPPREGVNIPNKVPKNGHISKEVTFSKPSLVGGFNPSEKY